jgi:hypothetical protein
MIIKETTVFTKKILALLPDEDYGLLQEELVNNPEIGKLIKNSGGIRKFRWGLGHKGKSGGAKSYILLAYI